MLNPKNKYLYWNGEYYDVGTKVKFKTCKGNIVDTVFIGNNRYLNIFFNEYNQYSPSENYVIQIIDPIRIEQHQLQSISNTKTNKNTREYPSKGLVEVGWVWYILIILVGSIFIDKWLIWIIATLIFFAWKEKQL